MNEVYSGMFFYSQRTAKITVHNFFCIILKLHFHSNKAKVIWHIWQHRLAVDNIFCRITSCHRPAVILDLIEAETAPFDPPTQKTYPRTKYEVNTQRISYTSPHCPLSDVIQFVRYSVGRPCKMHFTLIMIRL